MKRALVAAVAVALALSLAACFEDDSEPEFAPPESTSPSTPDTSPTEPAEKEAWEQNTRAGAVAFVKHWFVVFSDAMPDGDVTELRAISAPGCVTCRNFANRLEAIYQKGGFYRSDGWNVLRTTPGSPEGLDPGELLVLARVQVGAERSKEDAQAKVIVNPDTRADYTARVQWADEAWVMNSLVRLT